MNRYRICNRIYIAIVLWSPALHRTPHDSIPVARKIKRSLVSRGFWIQNGRNWRIRYPDISEYNRQWILRWPVPLHSALSRHNFPRRWQLPPATMSTAADSSMRRWPGPRHMGLCRWAHRPIYWRTSSLAAKMESLIRIENKSIAPVGIIPCLVWHNHSDSWANF